MVDISLAIFKRIPNETITKLGNFFDSSMINIEPTNQKIQEILGADFHIVDIKMLKLVFVYFVASKIRQNEVFDVIDNTKLSDDKKKILKKTVKDIHDKTDLDDLTTNATISSFKKFGHQNAHTFKIVSEFRPISESGKITKFIPSLIVDIEMYDSDGVKTINFQLDQKIANELIDELKKGIEFLNVEIKDIRNKFGDKIIE